MNKFAFPEQHRVLLILGCFLAFGGKQLSCLLLLNLVNLSKSTTSNLLDDLEATIEDLLIASKHVT